MCCEECPKYEKCDEADQLKEDCCPKCPEYYNCVGKDDKGEDRSGDLYEDDHNDFPQDR